LSGLTLEQYEYKYNLNDEDVVEPSAKIIEKEDFDYIPRKEAPFSFMKTKELMFFPLVAVLPFDGFLQANLNYTFFVIFFFCIFLYFYICKFDMLKESDKLSVCIMFSVIFIPALILVTLIPEVFFQDNTGCVCFDMLKESDKLSVCIMFSVIFIPALILVTLIPEISLDQIKKGIFYF